MLEIKNTEVFGLERAIKASGNPMSVGEIDTQSTMTTDQYFDGDENKDSIRAKKLGSSPNGSAHDHFLLGIHVQFDIKYPQYWTIEAERYHNFEIIASQSKMHRLTKMINNTLSTHLLFNKYVDHKVIDIVQQYIKDYNTLYSDNKVPDKESQYEAFMKCVSNLPMGFEMWMTCDLTFLQLKTIYFQRHNHKLQEDWGTFCDWCLQLPMFKELVGIKE